MSGILLHTFNFEKEAIDGSTLLVSKRTSDLVNTPRFPSNPHMAFYTPIGHASVDDLAWHLDTPEARELYSCFAPLTMLEAVEKKFNSWKYSYVEMRYPLVFPKTLPAPSAAASREHLRAALDERGAERLLAKRNVSVYVMPPSPEELTSPEPVPETPSTQPKDKSKKKRKAAADADPNHAKKRKAVDPDPNRMQTRVSLTPRTTAYPQPPRRLVLFRPLTVDELRAQERNMAAALAYITRVRIVGPNPLFEQPPAAS